MSSIKLSSGHSIPVIGLGVYQAKPEDTTFSVATALDSGYRHVDSAQYYYNEQETVDAIADFLEKNPSVTREQIFYTTKIVPSVDETYESTLEKVNSSYQIAKKIGYIDLLLVHAPVGSSESRAQVWKAFEKAVQDKQVKSIGVSNYGIPHLKELIENPETKIKPVINQIEVTPWNPRKEIVDFCKKHDIVIEAWGPLTQGAKLGDASVKKIADKYNATPAQVLIAWGISKGYVTLPKSVTKQRIIENLKSGEIKLSAEDADSIGDPNEYYLCTSWWDPSTWPLDNKGVQA